MPRSKGRARPRSSTSLLRIKKRKSDQAESVWEHLRNLMLRELSEEAILMYEVTNLCDKDGKFVLPTNFEDMETFFEIGRAFYITERFAQCDHIYQTLINSFPMPKFPDDQTAESDFCEDTVRHAHHECLMKMKRYYDAYACLTTIERPAAPMKQKAAYMNVVNASQNKKTRDKKGLTPWYPAKFDENGLKYCQSSIGSATHYVKFSKTEIPDDFIEKFTERFSGEDDRHNVEMWLKGQEAAGKHDYVAAISFLKRMTHCNSRIQTEIGRFYYKAGKREEARRILQIVHDSNIRWIDSMDLLAFLLSSDEKKHGKKLVHLATTLLELWPNRSETYTAAAYMSMNMDWHVAYDYTARAMSSAEVGSEQYGYALLLRCQCFQKMNRPAEALRYLREGVSRDRNNIELCREFVKMLLENDEPREAKNLVTSLVFNNPFDVNAKVLKAHVFINATSRNRETHNTNIDIIRMLEDILQQHPMAIGQVIDLLAEYYKMNQTETCEALIEQLEKNKLRIPYDQMSLYHQIQSEYNLRCQRPTKSYRHAIYAQTLGYDVTSTHITRIEQEYRNNCQHVLDEQFSICSSPSSTVVAGEQEPETSVEVSTTYSFSSGLKSPLSTKTWSSAEGSGSKIVSSFENSPSCSYNLRSRTPGIRREEPGSNLSDQSIDDDLDLSYPMTAAAVAMLEQDYRIFSPDLDDEGEDNEQEGEEEVEEEAEDEEELDDEELENEDEEEVYEDEGPPEEEEEANRVVLEEDEHENLENFDDDDI